MKMLLHGPCAGFRGMKQIVNRDLMAKCPLRFQSYNPFVTDCEVSATSLSIGRICYRLFKLPLAVSLHCSECHPVALPETTLKELE